MNGCRSLWLWLQWSTIRTGPLRTTPYEARRQSPEPERWRSASCTTRRGARSLLHRGRGQHLSSRCSRRGLWCSTVASSSSCRSLMSLCCRWWNSRWKWTLSFAFPYLRLPSRLLKCPSLPFLVVLFRARLCLSRSWWNSWWTCRLCCPFPCSSSGFPSRSSTLQFLTVVEQVLVEVFKASPRDRAHQRFLAQVMSTVWFRVVEEVLVEVFTASPMDRAQQRFLEQITLTLRFTVVEEVLVEVFTASPMDRAQHRFLEQITLTLRFTVVEEVLGEVFQASPKDRAHQRFVEQNMSTLLFLTVVLVKEVFNVFLVDRVPQRLPSSRIFLRLLILRCHKPRFMAVMTSGCAWLMWRTTTSTTGTGGITLRAGGCRGELSTAGAGSPLVSTWMLCWGRSSRIFPLSDQKDSHAVVLVVMTPFPLFLLSFTVVSVLSAMLGSTLATCSLVCCTQFQAGSTARVSTAPVAEPTVMSFTVPLNGYTIVATAFIVIPYSSSAQPCLRGPMCCRSVCVAMSCGGGFSPGGAYNSVWDSVMPMRGNFSFSSSIKLSSGVYAC